MLSGYLYRGTCLGITSESKSFRDDSGKQVERTKYFLGLQSETQNKYGVIDKQTDDFIIPSDLVSNGFHKQLHSHKGQFIEIKFIIKKWEVNGRSGENIEVTGFELISQSAK